LTFENRKAWPYTRSGVGDIVKMAEAETAQDVQTQPEKPKNKKYRRDKPWDHEGIDHWKVHL
jgi:ribosomal RNA assembly protein